MLPSITVIVCELLSGIICNTILSPLSQAEQYAVFPIDVKFVPLQKKTIKIF